MSCSSASTLLRGATAFRLIATLLPLAAIADVHAVVRCIDSDVQIESTLDAALASANAVEDVRIKSGNFFFSTGAAGYAGTLTGSNKTLTLSGGWSGLPGLCTAQNGDPSSTVFWGEGERQVLDVIASPTFSGSLIIENMSIGGGLATTASGQSCLGVSAQTGAALSLRVDRVRFEACRTAPGIQSTAVTLEASTALIVRNSLFAGNDSGTTFPVSVIVRGGTGHVLNNTFADNVSAEPSGYVGISASASNGGTMLLANNLFDRNVATAGLRTDIRVVSNVTLRNNRYTGRAGIPVEESGASTGEAGFGTNDYFLSPASTARDAGVAFAADLQGNRDLANQLRVQRDVVDLGALEFSSVFDDGFE